MKTVTSEQMAILDMNASWLGVSRLQLMENAGRAVAERTVEEAGGVEGKKVLVLCGPGNNGGDGMVAARHLAAEGANVTVMLLASPDSIRTPEARANYASVRNMPFSIRLIVADTFEELARRAQLVGEADIIVDAILGTGVRGRLSELFASAIEMANTSQALKVAVDIPSGLDPDTGYGELFFQPDIVVTFHRPKPALLNRGWRVYTAPIGIPEEAGFLAGPGQFNQFLRKYADGLKTVRLAYIYGDGGPDQDIQKFLAEIPISSISCHYDSLVTSPQNRQFISSSHSILLSPDVNPQYIRPFTPRGQPMIIPSTTTLVPDSIYVMLSNVRHGRPTRETLAKMLDDVRSLSLKLRSPIYVVGEVDAMSDGEEQYLNWVEMWAGPTYFKYIPAILAWLTGTGCKPLTAMASTSYISRAVKVDSYFSPASLATQVKALIGF
ncbi:Bifunctional NAD(P)H-hydrate repair enzyme Nnr [archaeon HR01]|nr:Bifunctional NAD(P)H-hydrate repair enzyme Nnr [archaeon HR01]